MSRTPQQRGIFGGYEPPHGKKFAGPAAGYAAPPGSGPIGETCGTCANCRIRRVHERNVYKCALREKDWTHDRSSDVLIRSPACLRFHAGKPVLINNFGKPI